MLSEASLGACLSRWIDDCDDVKGRLPSKRARKDGIAGSRKDSLSDMTASLDVLQDGSWLRAFRFLIYALVDITVT